MSQPQQDQHDRLFLEYIEANLASDNPNPIVGLAKVHLAVAKEPHTHGLWTDELKCTLEHIENLEKNLATALSTIDALQRDIPRCRKCGSDDVDVDLLSVTCFECDFDDDGSMTLEEDDVPSS